MTEQKDPMQMMAKAIDTTLNGHTMPLRFNGFVLLVFPFDADGETVISHVANCDRKDMIAALKSLVAKFEGQVDVKGRS